MPTEDLDLATLPDRGAPANWHTPESIRNVWDTAEDVPDSLLIDLLYVARESVIEFAPPIPEALASAGRIPYEYRMAHLMQTRNLWNAVEVDSSGGFGGEDTYTIRPMPLDWIIKQVLRPKRAVPVAL